MPVLGLGQVVQVERGHAEHLAGTLGVGGRDDRRVDVHKAALLEELVDGEGGHAANAEDGAEEVGAAAQVLLGAQELAGLALLLHGVVGGGGALHHVGLGLQLKRLRTVGRELEHALEGERRSHGLRDDVVVDGVAEVLAVDDYLQVLEAAAVVERDEAEVLHVADGTNPSGDGDGLAAELGGVGIQAGDGLAVHGTSPLQTNGRPPAQSARPRGQTHCSTC